MGHQTGSGRSPGFMKKQGPPPCGRNMVGSFMDYISDGPSFRTSALSLPIRKHMVYEADMTKFTVNDRPVQYRMDPDTPLLWALRDASNLTGRSEEHTSELQSLMSISYAVFCLKKK